MYLWLIFNCATFQYTIAMMGYGPEEKNAVLELTYNYGVKEYDKGNGYAQVNEFNCFFIIIIIFENLFQLSKRKKYITNGKHELCLKVSLYTHRRTYVVAFMSCNLPGITLQR